MSDYHQLKDQIEALIREGHLQEYINWVFMKTRWLAASNIFDEIQGAILR